MTCPHFDRITIANDGTANYTYLMPWEVRGWPVLARRWAMQPDRCCELAARGRRWTTRFPEYRYHRHGVR